MPWSIFDERTNINNTSLLCIANHTYNKQTNKQGNAGRQILLEHFSTWIYTVIVQEFELHLSHFIIWERVIELWTANNELYIIARLWWRFTSIQLRTGRCNCKNLNGKGQTWKRNDKRKECEWEREEYAWHEPHGFFLIVELSMIEERENAHTWSTQGWCLTWFTLKTMYNFYHHRNKFHQYSFSRCNLLVVFISPN